MVSVSGAILMQSLLHLSGFAEVLLINLLLG